MNNRSLALDVFRGLTVALMILVNNPGSAIEVYAPFLHATWHGLTPTDLVFPFFLFAIGNALAIVLPKLTPQKILKRTLMIFAIGLALNWAPFFTWVNDELIFRSWTWTNSEGHLIGFRILGVLQRIALCYGVAGLICYYFPKRILSISFFILLVYWILCYFLGRGDPYSLEGWFGTAVDRTLLGPVHLYQGEGAPFDPEGLMSTLPAIAQVLLGFWVGNLLVTLEHRVFLKKSMGAALLWIGLGLLWHPFFPINKKIWSSSYVLATSGLAILGLMLLVWLLDMKKLKNGQVTFFEAFGKNPLFIFVLSGFIPRMSTLIQIPEGEGYITPLKWFYLHICAHFPGDPKNGSLIYALLLVAAYGLIAWFMDKRKIYIRV
jgi:predicted acyltransferase